MSDFRRIALFCLEKRLSKHKMTMFSKNFGGAWPLWPHLAAPMSGTTSGSAVARVSEAPPEISRGAPHTLLAYYYELQ